MLEIIKTTQPTSTVDELKCEFPKSESDENYISRLKAYIPKYFGVFKGMPDIPFEYSYVHSDTEEDVPWYNFKFTFKCPICGDLVTIPMIRDIGYLDSLPLIGHCECGADVHGLESHEVELTSVSKDSEVYYSCGNSWIKLVAYEINPLWDRTRDYEMKIHEGIPIVEKWEEEE